MSRAEAFFGPFSVTEPAPAISEMDMQASAAATKPSGVYAPSDLLPLQTGPLAIVGGCGHVGLPLGLAFARKGFQVDLVDTSAERAAQVNRGEMPFHEDDAEALLKDVLHSGLLKATTDTAALEDASAIIVTIGTPVDEYLDPSVCEFDRSLGQMVTHV